MDGALVATIADEVGATGLAVSADGNTLYVALTQADAVSVVDLATLTERRRIPTGKASCPTWLATAAGRLWVSYGCSYSPAAVAALDPTLPAVDLPPGPLADGIVAGTTLVCPLHARRFDLATGAAVTGDCPITTYPARVGDNGEVVATLAAG